MTILPAHAMWLKRTCRGEGSHGGQSLLALHALHISAPLKVCPEVIAEVLEWLPQPAWEAAALACELCYPMPSLLGQCQLSAILSNTAFCQQVIWLDCCLVFCWSSSFLLPFYSVSDTASPLQPFRNVSWELQVGPALRYVLREINLFIP